ncbi:MAG: LOG family protein [Methanocorpusculum sp.]|nr:LOG family protein [Methanocorpusculum sp.]
MRRPLISVIGDGSLEENSPKEIFAFELGKALVDNGYRIVSGGLGGVMKAAFRGAHSSEKYREGDTVAILPGNNPVDANEFADIVIATGLDAARNFIVANSDAVVAVGGGCGTLSELSYAWALKRLILAYRVPNCSAEQNCFSDWSLLSADKKLDDKVRYENISDDRIYGVDSADEAVRILNEKLPLYNERPKSAGNRRA